MSIWSDKIREIREKYGSEYLLRQLAEESAELAQAALKLIRAKRKETPVTVQEARADLVKELADVSNMFDAVFRVLLEPGEQDAVREISTMKQLRMYDRLMNGGGDDGQTETGLEILGGADLP